MKKIWMALLVPAVLLALMMVLPGCFSSPTNPHESAFGHVGSDVNGGGGTGSHATPTPLVRLPATPTATPVVSVGTISGTISGTTSGGTIVINATSSGAVFSATRVGLGTYTISNVTPDVYTVEAYDTAGNMGEYNSGAQVTVTSGGALTGIDISLH